MENLKIEDFELFSTYGGKSAREEPEAHTKLRAVYDKLEHICNLLPKDRYECHIIKNPRNQGQKYEKYHWAQVYPKELLSCCEDKVTFIIGINSGPKHKLAPLKIHNYIKV